MGFGDIFFVNPFARFFRFARKDEEQKEQEEAQNSQGVSQEEFMFGTFNEYQNLLNPGTAMTYIGIAFEQYFNNKAGRISKYREMALFPEISDALDQICDDAIVENHAGEIVTLEITEELPTHAEQEIRELWDYLITDVFAFNERGWDLFRKWLVEAELYVEMILNEEGTEIIGVKVLPSYSMMPVYRENKITGYVQTLNINRMNPNQQVSQSQQYASQGVGADVAKENAQQNQNIYFDKEQVAYSNYGLYGESLLDVRGFLESAIRTYNILKNLEDALVVYRLVRAPERRVWNIATGRMPKGKAEEYIKGLIQRYKKRIVYDPETGAMNSAQNVQALTEDFWFSKNDQGEGTTVDTIGGGMNLGEIDDVSYFLQKLYKTMKLPRSRWESPESNTYSSGKSGEIQREEIKFARFIERLQRRFKYILFDPFMTLMKLKGVDERYIDYGFYNIKFEKANLFKEYKELELTSERMGLLASINEFIYQAGENENGFFSKEFVLRNYFQMSDNEWEENNKLLEREREASEAAAEPEGGEGEDFGGGGGDFGGDFGGEEDFGGGDEAGELPGIGGGEGLTSPETPIAPESNTIDFGGIEANDTSLFQSWMKDDKDIQDKTKNNARDIHGRGNREIK